MGSNWPNAPCKWTVSIYPAWSPIKDYIDRSAYRTHLMPFARLCSTSYRGLYKRWVEPSVMNFNKSDIGRSSPTKRW